jgi:hypothetical protein
MAAAPFVGRRHDLDGRARQLVFVPGRLGPCPEAGCSTRDASQIRQRVWPVLESRMTKLSSCSGRWSRSNVVMGWSWGAANQHTHGNLKRCEGSPPQIGRGQRTACWRSVAVRGVAVSLVRERWGHRHRSIREDDREGRAQASRTCRRGQGGVWEAAALEQLDRDSDGFARVFASNVAPSWLQPKDAPGPVGSKGDGGN